MWYGIVLWKVISWCNFALLIALLLCFSPPPLCDLLLYLMGGLDGTRLRLSSGRGGDEEADVNSDCLVLPFAGDVCLLAHGRGLVYGLILVSG